MHRKTVNRFLVLVAVLVTIGLQSPGAPAAERTVPARVLITNDNGIDDPKLVALARGFAAHAETWVVAPAENRSGAGAYLQLPRSGALAVERRDLGPGINAFAVDGYPGDCVLIALAGMMRETPPDLVVSGINGGPNLGGDWLFSGTVGATRVAAFAGFPAIAVSGLDDDIPGAVDAAVDWVVRLSAHAAVGELEPGEYLTVSLPRRAPSEIRGVRVVDRAPMSRIPKLAYDEESSTWRLVGLEQMPVAPTGAFDEVVYEEGIIAVVPMRADEVAGERLTRWLRASPRLPEWRPAAAALEPR